MLGSFIFASEKEFKANAEDEQMIDAIVSVAVSNIFNFMRCAPFMSILAICILYSKNMLFAHQENLC